ncbi:MAG: M43 family zinc metalloprotease [Crocinitomicaceae bacterium]
MKKIYLLLLQSVLFIGFGQAQTGNTEVRFCGASEKMEEMRNSDPKLKASMEASRAELEAFTKNYIKNVYDPNAKTILYTIPVVFHVIHTGGIENISDAQILDAIVQMNIDYSRLNPDTTQIVPIFKPIAADCQIQFKLAKLDPNGQCTNGITRTFSNTTNTGVGQDQAAAVQADAGNWPGNKYLNIFVVANCGGAAGYSTYPNDWTTTSMSNGIFILHSYVGSIGTASPYVSTALSHEAGHWCNLAHCWGNTNTPADPSNCSDDDGVSDTPNTIGWTTCNINGSTCSHPGPDNVQNYMEYSYCSKMFTEGQKARMHAALNSTTGGRKTVVSAANLIATGVNNPDVFCKADFSASTLQVCIGGTVDFTDHSYFGANHWTWSFTGGSPASASTQNPTITYNTPGTYAVSLTSGDGTGTDSENKTAYITVLPSQGNLPVQEGFESYSNIASSGNIWSVESTVGNQWEIFNGAGFTGTKCVRINNSGQTAGTKDALVSSSYDLSNLSASDQVTLSFRTAFKQKISTNTDNLKIYASKDCGQNWSVRKNITSTQLSSGVQTAGYIPASSSEWMTTHVTNILSSYFTNGFRLKFEFEFQGGNNIYLDNINLYKGGIANDPLSINELQNTISDFNLYPNPTVGDLNVMISIPQAMNFEVSVLDLSGKQLQSHSIQGQSGVNNVVLDVNSLSKGMYFIQVTSSNGKITKQFIRQ